MSKEAREFEGNLFDLNNKTATDRYLMDRYEFAQAYAEFYYTANRKEIRKFVEDFFEEDMGIDLEENNVESEFIDELMDMIKVNDKEQLKTK